MMMIVADELPDRPDLSDGASFGKSFHFDAEGIAAFASAAGDTNPLHHDLKFAERSQFGGIIASGTQYTALMMGLVADHFTRNGQAVGLEFGFRFKKAVPAGATMDAQWTITDRERSDKLGGHILHLSGLLTRDGIVYVMAHGKILALHD